MKIEVLLSAVLTLLMTNGGALAGDVVDAADVAAALEGDAIVWDVRAAEAYASGHIPCAVNIPFEQNWVDPDTPAKLAKGEVKNRDGMALKTPDQLKNLYADLDPGKETIVYCQSGVRASETGWVLHGLGFGRVRVFEESWLGYGNDLAAPAEDVQSVNIGLLNAQIKSLESEVKYLTAEVKTLKALEP